MSEVTKSAKSSLRQLPQVVKYLMALAVVAFISLLYPNHLKFKYDFEKGQVWHYDDLEAPFDFAVQKSAAEINTEREELERGFPPCYELDQRIAKSQQALFEREFANQLEQVKDQGDFPDVSRHSQKYLKYGSALLRRLFDRGIVRLDAGHAAKGEDFVVQVINGHVAERRTIGNLMPVDAAKALLSDSLPYSRLQEPDFLYPLLEGAIQPNVFYSDSLTNKFKAELSSGISRYRGMVRKGELIIARNGIVTDEIYQRLLSFKEQYEEHVVEQRTNISVFAGYLLLTLLVVGMLILYLQRFAKEVFRLPGKLAFVLMWLVVYSYVGYVVEKNNVLSAYMIPFCIVPIVIKTFYNERLALIVHISVVLIASFITSLGYEFAFMQILAGLVVLISYVSTSDWSRFFNTLLFIFLTYGFGYLGLTLIQEGSLSSVNWSVYSWIFLNVFLTLLAYPLIPLLERVFGFISPITLQELSDMNKPLLRELAIKAPGTLQHSLQVGNIAEQAARRIGADALLVKVAALYHDIGKAQHPKFFIENQSGENPHQGLSELESAQIIISHVPDGVQMAKKAGLPRIVIDFIRTHHGTTRTEYFYRNYVKKHPGEAVDEAAFRYPGPRPRTKEESIFMLADSIEAACKSLANPTEAELFEKIDKIIQEKINQGQLEHSALSFDELETCKSVFKQFMKSAHHVRIAYPEGGEGRG